MTFSGARMGKRSLELVWKAFGKGGIEVMVIDASRRVMSGCGSDSGCTLIFRNL